MRKIGLSLVVGLILVVVFLQSAVSFSQGIIQFDRDRRIVFVDESAWDILPVYGDTSKESLLKQMKLPAGWKVRGMYTKRLLAEIGWDGKIIIKEY